MSRNRFASHGDTDGLQKSIDKVAKEATNDEISEKLNAINITLRLLLLHANRATGADFTEGD